MELQEMYVLQAITVKKGASPEWPAQVALILTS